MAVDDAQSAERVTAGTLATNPDPALARLDRRATFWTLVCGLSAVVAFTGNFLPDEWLDIPAAGLFVFLATVWPAYRLRSRHALEKRRRELRPMTTETVHSIDRAPVLYLRSFEDDQRGARIKGSLTEEEHLAKVLSQFGPFVAIGRPGEALPEAGATRVYVGDANWQSAVEELLGNANLVIVRTGRTMGLGWEVERAVRILRPQQLVLLVDNSRELRNILERISHVHPQVRRHIRMGWRSIGSIRGFILFDDEWRASWVRARGPGLYFFLGDDGDVGHTTKRLAWTLRPLFKARSATWQGPSPNWGLIVLTGLAAALFLVAIAAEILGF